MYTEYPKPLVGVV